MTRCDWRYRVLAFALDVNSSDEVKTHVEGCLVCQMRMKFVMATIRGFSQRSKDPRHPTLVELVERCTRFEKECVLIDDRNQRLVVKQEYCFCGTVADYIPVPLREGSEQRVNLGCLACGARWRAAHCRSGCGAPLDDRFDELCLSCNWIKCPAGHCSNDQCLEPEETSCTIKFFVTKDVNFEQKL